MADPQVRIGTRSGGSPGLSTQGDVEMGGADENTGTEVGASGGAGKGENEGTEMEPPTGDAEAEADEFVAAASTVENPQTAFLEYLKSPIVELGIGPEDDATVLTAHQALLSKSPYFADALAQFSNDVTMRRIDMPSENLEAMGCFLQFMYTGEYYPKLIQGRRLELDEGDDGQQLLKHARVYTLARKLKVPDLATLTMTKITFVDSTAKGEIDYARYVYGNTEKGDQTIRKPIAAFWGARSHALRHEAEDEFKGLCIEFPEFAFDVLTHVLDSKERRSEKDRESEVTKSGRKRLRQT